MMLNNPTRTEPLLSRHTIGLKENTNNGQTMVDNDKQTTLFGNTKNKADYYEEMGNFSQLK
jgi:hypothetical protein